MISHVYPGLQILDWLQFTCHNFPFHPPVCYEDPLPKILIVKIMAISLMSTEFLHCARHQAKHLSVMS